MDAHDTSEPKVGGGSHGRRGPAGWGLVSEVRSLCRRERLFVDRRRVLVMVSGGQDSLALLHLVATRALGGDGPDEVVALHVNHHLREAESDADERLVTEQCGSLGVVSTVAHAPIDKTAGNVQERARTARRSAALDTMRAHGLDGVVLGHTLDDQVETMLYRLGRYGGIDAFAAMGPSDPPFVRPLLTVRRPETAAYCDEVGLRFAVDSGNESARYARTALRDRVIPAWEAALPGAVAAAGRAAEVAAEAKSLVENVVDRAAERCVVVAGGDSAVPERETVLSIAGLRSLPGPVARGLLRRALGRALGSGPSRRVVLSVEALLSGDEAASVDVGAGVRVLREAGLLFVGPLVSVAGVGTGEMFADSADAVRERRLAVPGEARWGALVVRARADVTYRAHDPLVEAYLDADAVRGGPLWVRGVREGDVVRPLGAPGVRRVQDILVDAKMPASRRGLVPVVGRDDRILWVAGFVVAEQGRIGPATRAVVGLTVSRVA